MDQYFDLIERYNEANPTMEDGTENIPYTFSAMTGDISALRMRRSFWMDIQTTAPVS